MTDDRRADAAAPRSHVGRPAAAPQGGRAARHRQHQLDRQHPAARAAAHGDPAQPDGARPDHPDRRRRRRSSGPAWSPRSPAADLGDELRLAAVRLAGHRRHHDARRTRRSRSTRCATSATRRGRRRRRPLRGGRRARGDRGRLRAAARRVDMEAALADGLDLVHADLGTNKCYTWKLAGGDYEAAKAQGRPGRVTRRYVKQRLIPMRDGAAGRRAPRRSAASGELTLWSSTQIPHILRVLLALTDRHPGAQAAGHRARRRRRLRLQAAVLPRGDPSRAVVAHELGRPVKWTETRSENAQATHHGRDQIQDIEIAATNDGKILGLRVDLLANMGAYLQLITPGIPLLGAFMYNAHLQDGGLRLHLHRRLHRPRRRPTPTAAPGGRRRRSPSSGSMDDLAAELGVDPLELRRRTGSSTRSSRTRPSPG